MRTAEYYFFALTPLFIALCFTANVEPAHAGIELQSGSPDTPTQDLPEPLVSPLRVGGIPMRTAPAASSEASNASVPLWLFSLRSAPPPVTVVAPRQSSASHSAVRSLMRAHAFSQNAYRELRDDNVLPWWYAQTLWAPQW